VETDGNYDRDPHTWCGDHLRHTFNQFINWHNPLEVVKNTKQVRLSTTLRLFCSKCARSLQNTLHDSRWDCLTRNLPWNLRQKISFTLTISVCFS
jgi:hypothetical protein